MPFDIIICGAGIAGLVTDIGLAKQKHRVLILDEAQSLSPIGVGLHIPPNNTRVLQKMEIAARLQEFAQSPTSIIMRRYADTFIIKQVPFPSGDSPYWTIKRSDYQRVLAVIATEAGCEIRLRSKVISYDATSILLASGEQLAANLIVGADDLSPHQPSHHISCFCTSVTKAELLSDPLTAPLLEHCGQHQWLGYNRDVILYPILNGDAYFISSTHPASEKTTSQANIDVYSQSADAEKIQAQLQNFHPTARKIFKKAIDAKEWTLADVPRLPCWTNERVVLIGDAAHSMLPYLGQGAAMATEDAAALVECVKRAQSLMRVYERIRRRRCEVVSLATRRTGESMHLADGEEKEERDRAWSGKPMQSDWPLDVGPMADARFRRWLMDHDVIEYCNQLLDQMYTLQ